MVCVEHIDKLKERIKKYGITIEKYPDRAVAKYGNIVVESRVVNDTIETTIKGIATQVKGVLKTKGDHLEQTVYLGPIPVASAKYKVNPEDFRDNKTLLCILAVFGVIWLVAILLIVAGLAELDPLFIIVAVLALLLGPGLAILICLAPKFIGKSSEPNLDLVDIVTKLGGKIEEYPNKVVGTYKNIRVESKFVDNKIETVISGVSNTPTIKGVLKRGRDGKAIQTIYVGSAPVLTVRYLVPYDEFLNFPMCILRTTVDFILASIMLLILGILTLPIGGVIALVGSIYVLVLAPAYALVACLIAT